MSICCLLPASTLPASCISLLPAGLILIEPIAREVEMRELYRFDQTIETTALILKKETQVLKIKRTE